MLFKRKVYEKMLQWKQERRGSTALLLQGARRVGKSTLVEQFAQNEYKSYILIDFNTATKQINSLFEDISNLNYFFMRLQAELHVTLYERESVIVFDEVQQQPLARQAIKYLVKDGRYDYIETGSLLTIKRNVRNITIPSEETRITLFPLDFEEFYWAIGNNTTPILLKQFFEFKQPLRDTHRTIMREFRLYMLIGGMPQAIETYLETNNLEQVDYKKREIIQLYNDDFRKIDSSGRASRLFFNIPSQLSTNASRYQVASAGYRKTESIESVIADMEDSKVVNLAYHANDPNVGFSLNKDMNRYKMFLNDTGLFVTLAFWDKDFTDNVIYQKLLSDKLDANLGYIYENMIAQMLLTSGNTLYYYTFPNNNNHNYEIDFLLSRGNKIVPIEVKSSGYKSHKSLDLFCAKYSSRIGERILLYTKDYAKDGSIMCLPIYYAPFL